MIKPHQFIGLGAATVVSLLTALGVYAASNQWTAGRITGETFLPELGKSVGSVAALEITRDGRKLTVEGNANAWTLRDRAGYPVKTEAVRALLVALAQSQLVEPKTANKDKLALLELEDPAGKDAKSRHVRILDKAGKPISDIVLGKSRYDAFGAGKGGTYVRRAGETQSWLATGDPKISSDLTDWVDTNVFTSASAEITRLAIENPGEAPIVIEKPQPAAKPEPAKPEPAKPEPAKDGRKDAKNGKDAAKDAKPADAAKTTADAKAAADPAKPAAPAATEPAKEPDFQLVKLPDGMKLKKDIKLATVVDAFNTISLEDVRKAKPLAADEKAHVMTLALKSGVIVTFRLRNAGDDRWLSLAAKGEGAGKAQADAINAKAKDWEYRIADWKAKELAKAHKDLFEKQG